MKKQGNRLGGGGALLNAVKQVYLLLAHPEAGNCLLQAGQVTKKKHRQKKKTLLKYI